MALRPLAHLAVLAACAAAGCAGEEPAAAPQDAAVAATQVVAAAPPPGPQAQAQAAPAAATAARRTWSFAELPELFGPALPQLDAAGQVEAQRSEALLDDWPEESLLVTLQPALESLVDALLAGGDAFSARLAPGFEGGAAARPEPLATVRDEEGLRVRRAAPETLAAQPLAAEPFRASCAALAELVGPAPPRRILVVELARRTSQRVELELLVQLDRARPSPLQVNATWRLTLELAEGRAPRLQAFAVARHEELEVAAPWFVDAAQAVFGATPGWSEDQQRGVDDHFMRTDRIAGVAFQGMQGLAVGDVDGDGRDDVFVGMQVGLPNRLYLHQADGTARESAAAAGVNYLDVTRSALIVDLDNDGHRDLALAVANSIVVAYNDGKGVFSRQKGFTAQGQEQFYSLAAADADGDGDLDLYGCRYALGGVMHGAPQPYHDADNGAPNVYLRNDGLGRFADATEESGFAADNTKFSLAAMWVDFDVDLDMDLYVVNDFGRNQLFVNDGTGRFVERAAELGLQDIGAGMGASVADYDQDGDLDLYVTNMFSAVGVRTTRQERYLSGRDQAARLDYVKHARGNSLLRNRGDGSFEDVTDASGTALGRWAWGSRFADFDGDGWDDLFVPNGQTSSRRAQGDLEGFFWRRVVNASPVDPSSLSAYRLAFDTIQNLMMFGGRPWNGDERNNAYLNLRDGTFVEASHASGLGFLDDARCAALLDWDDDGREDLLVRNRTAPRLRLMLGRAPARRFVSFQLVGRTCNRDAIGAAVTVSAGGRTRIERVTAGEGYLSQSSTRLTFGLDGAERVERVSVTWPDGKTSVFEDLEVDRHYLIDQGAEAPRARAPFTPPLLAAAAFAPNERNPRPVDRAPLFDPLPMGAFELPAFDGPARRLRDLSQGLVLLHVWSGAHESGPAALAELGAVAAELAQANVRVVPLTVDEGAERAKARRTLAGSPFAADAGFVDGRTREALSILTLEMLGFFERVPLPVSLLIDRQSRACVLYLGPPEPERVLADARALAGDRLRPQQRARRLAGGPWFTQPTPRRDLGNLRDVLRGAGFEDLAAELDAYIALRNAAPAETDEE
jgi:hypothetical protein